MRPRPHYALRVDRWLDRPEQSQCHREDAFEEGAPSQTVDTVLRLMLPPNLSSIVKITSSAARNNSRLRLIGEAAEGTTLRWMLPSPTWP